MTYEVNTLSESVLNNLPVVGDKRVFIEISLRQAEQQLAPELREKIISAPKAKGALIHILGRLNDSVLNPEGGGINTISSVLHVIALSDNIPYDSYLTQFSGYFNALQEQEILGSEIHALFLKKEASFDTYLFSELSAKDAFLQLAIKANDFEAVRYLVTTCGANPETSPISRLVNDHDAISVYLLSVLSEKNASVLLTEALRRTPQGCRTQEQQIESLRQDAHLIDVLLDKIPTTDGSLFFETLQELSNRGGTDWSFVGSRFVKLVERFGFNEKQFNAFQERSGVNYFLNTLSSNKVTATAIARSLILLTPRDDLSKKLKTFLIKCAKNTDDSVFNEIVSWLEQENRDFSFIDKSLLITEAKNRGQDILIRLIQLPSKEQDDFLKEGFSFARTRGVIYQYQDEPWFPFFAGIGKLLSNPDRFFYFLDSLEKDLENACLERNIELRLFRVERTIVTDHAIPWTISRGSQKVNTGHLLNQLLLQVERRHGINLHPEAPAIFWGFVDKLLANNFIANGNLFNECKDIGNSLHGKYSHRIQWYVIFQAIEAGEIVLPEGFSVQELFKFLPLVWSHLVDLYEKTLHAPHYVHAYLLSSEAEERFPYLCHYSRKTHHSGFDKNIQRTPGLSAEQITVTYHIDEEKFGDEFSHPATPKEAYGEKFHSYHAENSIGIFFKKRSLVSVKDPDKTANSNSNPSLTASSH
jgi:hypothetical protein